jgi:hypothetical protein
MTVGSIFNPLIIGVMAYIDAARAVGHGRGCATGAVPRIVKAGL